MYYIKHILSTPCFSHINERTVLDFICSVNVQIIIVHYLTTINPWYQKQFIQYLSNIIYCNIFYYKNLRWIIYFCLYKRQTSCSVKITGHLLKFLTCSGTSTTDWHILAPKCTLSNSSTLREYIL